ncbi:condensation domain-containing protein [Candidatus Lokiarchaeum ossiferum]|uniref:condensation domain-containing protein n=1 Tax=Candidatus Lokiarchaeum ossiferum TaxID=2951803 RepID=UPI00352C2B42
MKTEKKIIQNVIEDNPIQKRCNFLERFYLGINYANVVFVARYLGNISEFQIQNAIMKLQIHHPLLRCRIYFDKENTPYFTSKLVNPIPFTYSIKSDNFDWKVQSIKEYSYQFCNNNDPLIRFSVFQSKKISETSEIILVGQHSICDGLSLAYLIDELFDYLGNMNIIPNPLPLHPGICRESIPDNVKVGKLSKFFVKKINKRWENEKIGFTQSDYEILHKNLAKNFNYECIFSQLSQVSTKRLINECKNHNISVNSAIITAFQSAILYSENRYLDYHKRIALAVGCRDRYKIPAKKSVGLFISSQDYILKYDQTRTFWENAKIFHKKISQKLTDQQLFSKMLVSEMLDLSIVDAIHFKLFASQISPDFSKNLKIKDFLQRQDIISKFIKMKKMKGINHGVLISNLGKIQYKEAYGDLKLTDVHFLPPSGGSHEKVLGIITHEGKLNIALSFQLDVISLKNMENFEQIFREILEFKQDPLFYAKISL